MDITTLVLSLIIGDSSSDVVNIFVMFLVMLDILGLEIGIGI